MFKPSSYDYKRFIIILLYSNKGHLDADHKGHKGQKGHEEHHQEHSQHGKKGGKQGSSQWGYAKKN